jgi:hypothetical protein
MRLAEAFDGEVGEEVCERAHGEAKRNGVTAAELHAFLGEVETDRADERTGAEGEHATDDALRPWPRQSKQRTQDE